MSASFKINGVSYSADLDRLPADITLNTFIREHAQLTATKNMCLEGGCGVCVCVITGKHPATGEMRTWAANSCLTLLNICNDWEITTCEGIGNKTNGYHPIQTRLAKMNGSQCGFCSPGMVANMYALMESKDGKVTMNEIEDAFGGNLCRCTGYRPILDAMKSFALDSTIEIPKACRDIEDFVWLPKMCPSTGEQCMGQCKGKGKGKPSMIRRRFLQLNEGTQWHWPKNYTELFDALKAVGDDEYILVGGNTAHGVYRRSPDIKHYIDLHALAEMKQYSLTDDMLTLGAGLTLTEAMEIFLIAAKKPGFEYCNQLWQHFDLIANTPVRNMGTLAGNINTKRIHAEFYSDIFITFEPLNIQVVINEDATTQKKISLMEYVQLKTPKIVLTEFELPAIAKDKYAYNTYKIMPRSQNAHCYINAGFMLEMDIATGMVNKARICYGGINPEFIHATAVESMLVGQNLYEKETVAKVFKQLVESIKPDEILPDATAEFRQKLAVGLFYKFLLSIAPAEKVKETYKSGGDVLKRPLSSGKQTFQTNEKIYPITQAVEKLEALIQTTGEATYMNDTLTTNNSVHCAFVCAKQVGAAIEEIDASAALAVPGVVAFFSAKDIPGANTFVDAKFGYEEEEILCSERVKYFNQPLGILVATTNDLANRSVDKVKVIYTKRRNAPKLLVTTDDVLAASATERIHHMIKSPVQFLKLNDPPADVTGKGIFRMGPQYHFTMEPHTTIAVPFEETLQVWSATQWMDHTQHVIAQMLKLKDADIQLRVRRLGGAYGTKITRCNQVACAASLVAYKLQRPARFVQTIESMMNCLGKRWGCRSDYEFHAKSNGKIIALQNSFYQDAGCTLNENPVPGHSSNCTRNCYVLNDSNYKLEGKAVVTDAPSSCWCRAPGSVEGIAMIENIMTHIAFEADIDPVDVRLANIKPGNRMLELLPRFVWSTEYRARRKEINEYNDKNRWRKRGLGIAIMEYPIVYYGPFPATISIYHGDGTVVISHGGIEMGQGINTKAAQVAAFVLGIPLEMVKVDSSNTVCGANAMVTGGAIGSESICFVVRKSCNMLNERLQPIRNSMKKDATWQEVVQNAWLHQVNLTASDSYKVGDMETYKVYGISLTEMEVDILTGNFQIVRQDLLEDTGESLSPYIDIGQIEGSFMMCLGYWLYEQCVYDRQTGELLTNRSWNYKVPGAKDIPIDFRIELLQNNPASGGFMRSKATGEPPCCLAISSIFALQHAVQSARKDAGLKREWVRFGAPTTPEHIILNAGSDVTSLSLD